MGAARRRKERPSWWPSTNLQRVCVWWRGGVPSRPSWRAYGSGMGLCPIVRPTSWQRCNRGAWSWWRARGGARMTAT
nr:MAG TPA: hypothetical protein [Caudoviricetes sp.]